MQIDILVRAPMNVMMNFVSIILQDIELGLSEVAGLRGRITIYCIAESLDRNFLQQKLEERRGNFLLHK
jgi:hypothetical protein